MLFIPEALTPCDEPGCFAPESDVIECRNAWMDTVQVEHFCTEHAVKNGHCYMCGEFTLGASERFEFGPCRGVCDECYAALRDEFDADEWTDDDDGLYDPYFDDEQYDNDYFDWTHDD